MRTLKMLIMSFFYMAVCHLSEGAESAASAQKAASEKPQSVSIIELIAQKKEFDGKHVIVKGYLHIDTEHIALYLSEESARKLVTKNGIWVSLSGKNVNVIKHNKKWVIIEGIYNANNGGHLDLWSGNIRLIRINESK